MIETVQGDLLTADVDMIVQQCNCITKSALGLSQSIKTILKVDPYGHRRLQKGKRNCAIEEDQDKPGTAKVYDRSGPNHGLGGSCPNHGLGGSCPRSGPRYVACLFAQYRPGKPSLSVCWRGPNSTGNGNDADEDAQEDSFKQRLIWFEHSLQDLTKVLVEISNDRKEIFKVAFPYLIGCGLAGGRWDDYKNAIESWALSLKDKANIQVFLFQKSC
jgi:O-acetyl-ADP-ribose deacetylase (regulator of RNase III)